MVPEQSISMTQIYEKICVCYGSDTEGIMQLWVDQILVLELRLSLHRLSLINQWK